MNDRFSGNFLDLLTYSNCELDYYDKGRVMRELDYYIKHPNNTVYDIINYEKLIYFEIRFSDDEEIMSLITQLKNIICRNYILRAKLLNRLTLQC